MGKSNDPTEMPSMIPEKSETVILYPRNERNREQRRLREEARLARIQQWRYHVRYEVNKGRGTDIWESWYRTEIGARIDAWFHTRGSRPQFTSVVLTKKW